MSTKNRTCRTTTRNIRLTKWLNKLTSLLSKKGPGISQPEDSWSLPSETNVRKETDTSIKSDEEWTSRVLPSEQDDIVNSLNYEGIAVIELQFYHFPDSDRLRVGSPDQIVWTISEIWDQSTNCGNNPSYYYRASPTLPQLLWMFSETPCSIHAITTSG